MTKKELEIRLGFELTQEGWEQLEKMYMSCELDKDEFARLVKFGAKSQFAEEIKKDVTFKGVKVHWVDYMGCWEIKDLQISLFRGSYYDTLEQAKQTIKLFKTR